MESTIDLASYIALTCPERAARRRENVRPSRRDSVLDHRHAERGAMVSTNPHADRLTARDPQCSFPAGSVAAVAGLHVGARHPATARSGRTGAGVPTPCGRADQSCAAAPSRFIAIDGKTLRQSFDAFADRKAAHVLSACAVDHQIILAHEVVDEKSNEIPAVQTLIATLGLSGRVFTLDAMHCQKNLRNRPRDRQ